MSVVLKLQKKCLDKSEDLQSLLREAFVISRKLKLKDFEEWINFELKGYKGNIPDYRGVSTRLKFFNPYQGWIPGISENRDIANSLSKTKIGQPIGELENLVKSTKNDLRLDLSQKQTSLIMEYFSTDYQPAQFINKTQIFGIIEQVRNLLLDWTLKLEEDDILGNDDLIFSETEKKAAKSVHIENFYGLMGNVDKVGNMSTGAHTNNTYNENNINNKIDELINEIKSLKLKDEQEIIMELEASKSSTETIKIVLGKLLTRSAEIGSIGSLVISILGLL